MGSPCRIRYGVVITKTKENPMMNARKQFTGIIVTLFRFLRNKKRALNLNKILSAMIVSTGYTITSWLRSTIDPIRTTTAYYNVATFGRSEPEFAQAIAHLVSQLKALDLWKRVYFIIDDTPTNRTGLKISCAGYHHDPTPSKTNSTILYGHSWVVISILVPHPENGYVSIPLRAMLYIKKEDIHKLHNEGKTQYQFKTKHTMAVELIRWASGVFRDVGKEMTLLIDGGYASNEVISGASVAGVNVITRLRKDSVFYELPCHQITKRRGRPRKFGEQIDLKRDRHHWKRLQCFGKTYEYKTLVVTSKLTAGKPFKIVISRTVKGKHHGNRVTLFSSDINQTAESILKEYSMRFSIEEMFKDLKEVEGFGKQQVRTLDANIGTTTLCLLMYVAIELWAYGKTNQGLTKENRGEWDDPSRRASHSDKRKALRNEILRNEFSRFYARRLESGIFRELENWLVSHCV